MTQQQKGEKMPTFEGQAATDHLNKASEFFDAWIMGHLGQVSLVQALANLTQAMEQRIRNEYACPPAASEERPFGQWTTFEQWWTDAGCKFNDPEILAVQAFKEGQRQALQSAPSSPLCPREDCPVRLVGTREPSQGETEYGKSLAAPSDAGQPAIAQHEMNRLAKEIKEDFEDEICGCHSGQCRDEMIWRAELAKAEMPALDKLRERIERLPRIGEGDWVSRKDVLAAIAAPAPRPAEKD